MNTKKDFLKKIQKTKNCWIWKGKIYKNGYGYFSMNSKSTTAQRYAYMFFKGEIPKGYDIDHLCRNRSCVNPNHLEAVTPKENLLRGQGICAKNARKTHCIRGHKFTKENTKITPKGRYCRKCNSLRQSKNSQENREKKLKWQKNWRDNNRQHIKEYDKKYKKLKKLASITPDEEKI